MENIFETMRRLPNEAARQRVMTHVTQLLAETAAESADELEVRAPTGNGKAEDHLVQ
jgi:hypothetical protein